MLILTRKPGESIYIGDNIKITIVELKGHQIRVGIDAPISFRIYREEIYLQILEEQKQAAQATPDQESLEGLTAAWTDRKSAIGPSKLGGLAAPRKVTSGRDQSGFDIVVKRKKRKKTKKTTDE